MSTKPDLLDRSVVLPASGAHKRTVIFLHGLGDEGASFVDVFEMLNLPNTKVILPNAPRKPVTCNGGYVMPAWYDIISLGTSRTLDDEQDAAGIMESSARLLKLIEYEADLVGGPSNIFIGGFSQGSAISVYTALQSKVTLGGVVGLSGYALLAYKGTAHITEAAKETPFLIYHGKNDQVVPLSFAKASNKFYETIEIKSLEYVEEANLAHSLSQTEIMKVKEFFNKLIQ